MVLPLTLALVSLALACEALAGYPAPLYRAIGHPVTWIGALIAFLDTRLNRETATFAQRRMAGIAALLVLLVLPTALAFGLEQLLPAGLAGLLISAGLASSLLAQRSLYTHVCAVADGLDTGGLPAGRASVAMIVGRNPAMLDEAGVARAAIESLAENFSDGIVAPAFWLGLGGLAGGVMYKAVNTADSMIGHRTARHAAFGWAAARFDDLINLPASRLAALWLVLAALLNRGASARGALAATWQDAGKHRSPNAGWPEAAMAGALGLQLAGPRVYGDTLVADALMGSGRRQAGSTDIRRALRLYVTACVVQFACVVLLSLVFIQQG